MKHKITYSLVGIAALMATHSFAAQPGSATVSVNLMPSGKIDLATDTLTLPLRHGTLKDGRSVWFVLTDTDNAAKAQELGIAYASELSNARTAKSTRTATKDSSGHFVFDAGTVDFKPEKEIVPGQAPALFPPKVAVPGSVGDENYSPFVRVTNEGDTVYNAPILAFDVDEKQISFCSGNVDHHLVHDKVVNICPERNEVTLALSHGYAASKPVVYVSFDANVELGATMEASTYAPAFEDLKQTGSSLDIYAVVNGEIGKGNPRRQGFNSALNGDGSPLNVLDGLPSIHGGYSPLWDLHVGVWTDRAIESGSRKLLIDAVDFLDGVRMGQLTGPGGTAFGSSGILINCPVVAILK